MANVEWRKIAISLSAASRPETELCARSFRSLNWTATLRIFLITLAVSTALSIGLWSFGFAVTIWPSHPFLATVLLAAGGAAVVQVLLTRDKTTGRNQK